MDHKKEISFFALISLLLVFSGFAAFAHEEEEFIEVSTVDYSPSYQAVQVKVVSYGSLAFLILIVIILMYHKRMEEVTKKIVYWLVAAVAGLVTAYLIATTLHLNIISETKGPIHWHADFEVWACDEKLDLVDPVGFSNKVGTPLVHEHNDNRMHIEGVVVDMKQASIGSFFRVVGGSLSSDGFAFSTNKGMVSFHEGDSCNGMPGRLYVFVNGKRIDSPASYVIAPQERVPPGDRIKVIFTEKSPEGVNPNIR